MMNLNNSIKNSCLPTIFDPFDHYDKYPHKKTCTKKAFWLQLIFE